MIERCLICSTELLSPAQEIFETNAIQYACPNCGSFELAFESQTSMSEISIKAPEKLPILSHAIRRMSKEGTPARIDLDLLNRILDTATLPTPVEQLENLLLWIGDNMQAFGESILLDPGTGSAAAGVANIGNFAALGKALIERGLFEGTLSMSGIIPGRLTLEGWQEYEELRLGRSKSRTAFMAMPFGEETLDTAFASCFKPAAKLAGFDLRRLDEEPPAGLIDDRLRLEIRRSRFVVADLTNENRGVYWEAGYAEGLGKPVIYTCETGYSAKHKSHFDTNHHLTIPWAADALESATLALATTIRATLPSEAALE